MNHADMPLIAGLVKDEIYRQYGSVRKFSQATGIPNTTLSSAFQKSLMSTSITLLFDLCAHLDLDVNALLKGKLAHRNDVQENVDRDDIHPTIYGLNPVTNQMEQLHNEDIADAIAQFANLPPEAAGDLKIVYEFLDFKYNKKGRANP